MPPSLSTQDGPHFRLVCWSSLMVNEGVADGLNEQNLKPPDSEGLKSSRLK